MRTQVVTPTTGVQRGLLALLLLGACGVDQSGISNLAAPPSTGRVDAGNRDGQVRDAAGAGGAVIGGAGDAILGSSRWIGDDGAMAGAGGGSGVGGRLGAGGTLGTVVGTGGRTGTGGVVGGAPGVGGLVGSGGFASVAGHTGSGGAVGTGGVPVTGGVLGTGGTSANGGRTGTGGAMGTGGSIRCDLGPFQAPEAITGLGLESMNHYGPALSVDGKTLFFSAYDETSDDDIYVATRANRGAAFSAATALDSINSPSDDGSPFLSNDGQTLYFYSTRPGGRGARDLWSARRVVVGDELAFASATVLGNVNGLDDDNLEWLSADELTLVFSSSRSGDTDLYIAKRTRRSDDFGAPEQLGGVNGPTSREDRAALSNDGLTIYFTSDRGGGKGDKDLWTATRPTAQSSFGPATNLEALNSSARDIDVTLSADETELFFASKRGGSFRLYRSVRSCP